MRKIKLVRWTEKDKEGKDIDVDLTTALSILMTSMKQEDMPKGFDQVRLFNRIAKSFDKAQKTKELTLEEADYAFLKKLMENNSPAVWGANDTLLEAMESFVSAKSE